MTLTKTSEPELFKGIALFTPGGDLVYSIDPTKKGRWHLHLCAALQEILGLPEPPHFLIPCYTATIDLWLDPRTQKVKTFAEAYPPVLRHQAILNTIFGTNELKWPLAPWQDGFCDHLMLSNYRKSFPQLWEDHDLVIRLDKPNSTSSQPREKTRRLVKPKNQNKKNQTYVLRLYIAGHSLSTENVLENLHSLLEKHLGLPYSLKIIDVLTHPEEAEADQVSATPTLVKVWPHPTRRIVGDLDNIEKIVQTLEMKEFRF
jgi:circadian clock protein KaiB